MTGAAAAAGGPDARLAGGLGVMVGLDAGAFSLDVAFHVGPGEIVAVVGPNGAGKTTLLEALSGARAIDRGMVSLDGTVLDDPDSRVFVAPPRRRVGVVTQRSSLFPHLSALDNVAFARRVRGAGRRASRAHARGWLERVGAGDLAERRPPTLSGGEAQRVALARALASEPRLLLLDEPLSAVDAGARPELRRVLDEHLREFDGVALVVTHDPLDVTALADRLVVIEDGRLTHDGTPAEVRAHPRTRFVADLVSVNLLRGTGRGGSVALAGGGTLVAPEAGEGPVLAVIHPRAVALHRDRPAGSPRNVFAATVADVEPEPWADRVRVRVEGEVPLVAELTPTAVAELDLAPGTPVWAAVKATEVATHPA